MAIGIVGVGKYIPEGVVSNQELETFLETSDEWIRSRTGIETRHIATNGEDTTEMAIEAAKAALRNADYAAKDIDLIVVATCTAEQRFPSVSCKVQEALQIENAVAFDLNAACSGFVYALTVVQGMMAGGAYKRALVIGTDKISKLIDWEERSTAVLFGDGAGAVVLSSVSTNYGILQSQLGSEGKGSEHLYEQEFIHMNGREVFKFATRTMPEAVIEVMNKADLDMEELDYLIPHQANIRIIEAACERLQIPLEKVSQTVRKYGNNSSASIPIALAEAVEEGKIADGSVVALVGFGAGLTWGSVLLRWGL